MQNEPQIYTEAWRALGVVSADEIAADTAELSNGEDPHPEHYRWKRFVKFIHSRTVIDAQLAFSLYELGEGDPERALGESMISVIIRREDCPRDLLEKALRSSSAHLRRVSAARLGCKNDEQNTGE